MIGFKKKILAGGFFLFAAGIAMLFPSVDWIVGKAVRNSLEEKALWLISRVRHEPDLQSMIESIRQEKAFVFFRATLFDRDGNWLYDTHRNVFPKEPGMETPSEVQEALQYGRGYADRFSQVFRQPFAYAAFLLEAQSGEYVLRIGLPSQDIREMTQDFEAGFLMLGSAILLICGLMAWLILRELMIPIQYITTAIEPYREGKVEFLPQIDTVNGIASEGEFRTLAETFNSLSARIGRQIESLIHQQHETEAILESLGEGIVAVDEKGRITFINRSASEMLKVSKEQAVEKYFTSCPSQRLGLLESCKKLIDKMLQTRQEQSDTVCLQERPSVCFALLATALAGRSGGILVLQDKTADRNIVEIGKEFIANASHELRTPITIIRGFAETLHEMEGLSPEILKDITAKILKTSLRFDGLVKSLLLLADVDSNPGKSFSPIDLVGICEHSIRLIAIEHPHANLAVHRKIEKAYVFGDADLIEMALLNVLQNAVKYSPSPAHVDLLIEKQKQCVQISVKDRGIGIPESDLMRIFDRFYTVDKAHSRKFGGSGLGLSIVKSILQKHRGDVSVSSRIGQGSTFAMTFPLDLLHN